MVTEFHSTVCFSIYAPPEPSVLPRVVGVFARLDLVPARLVSTIIGRRAEELCVDLQVEGMSAADRELVTGRLRNLVDVSQVLISEKQVLEIT